MPSVTVILPTWNRAEWLETAVESVLTQTFRDYELIVVDDASTDSTAEIFERYSGKIRCIILTKNRGVSAARNAAVLKSDREWIMDRDFLSNATEAFFSLIVLSCWDKLLMTRSC